ncbi:MAG: carbohydrate porin [Bdellovibrionaceae bacterium]|nr:carbohydrate porin [Pseudobdellovibrionaceae bacterium]MDW8190218.1 carbohydrate porin [Pseudobdellovibrionaceae bacterium]
MLESLSKFPPNYLRLLTLIVMIPLGSQPLFSAPEFSASGYLRYSTLWSQWGWSGRCWSLSEIPPQFSRLGNECGYYGELAAQLRQKGWTFVTRFSFFGDGFHPWENSDSDNKELQVTELYSIGHINSQTEVWVGRRFYRDSDIHIADWFYFADMIGQGAGLEWRKDHWIWQAAHLIRSQPLTDFTLPIQLHVMDHRIQYNVSGGFFKLVAALGYSPSHQWQGQEYAERRGSILGLKRRWFSSQGFWEVGLLHGKGVLQGINMWGHLQIPTGMDSHHQDERWRWVLHGAHNFFEKVGNQILIAGENIYRPAGVSFHWYGLNDRFTYELFEQWQVVGEIGFIQKIFSQPQDNHWLRRVTLGFQWAIDPNIWSRPQLRFLYSHSEKKEPDVTTEGHWVYQLEIWF